MQTLSQALNNSLKHYQEHTYPIYQKMAQTTSNTSSPAQKLDNSNSNGHLIVTEQQPNLKNNIEEEKPQTSSQNTITLNSSKQASHTSTDDEIYAESKENAVKKEAISKKKNKKNRREEKADDFEIIVPEVDINECAYITPSEFTSADLTAKKEQLMMRKVNECSDFLKGKKEKREIRMLGNWRPCNPF